MGVRGSKGGASWNGASRNEKSAKSALRHARTMSRGHVLMSWGRRRERRRRKRRKRRARKKFRMGGTKGKEEKYNVTLSGLGAGCEGNQRHL